MEKVFINFGFGWGASLLSVAGTGEAVACWLATEVLRPHENRGEVLCGTK